MANVLTIVFACLISLLAVSETLNAQVFGVVKEHGTGKHIKDALVFFNHSSISSQTSKAGKFNFENAPIGFVELIVYKKGYSLFKTSINISYEKRYTLNFELKKEPDTSLVKVSYRDVGFITQFLTGSEPHIKIKNLDDVKSLQGSTNKTLLLTSPLVVENDRLRYQLIFYPPFDQLSTRIEDLNEVVQFRPLPIGSLEEKKKTDSARTTTYWGSPRHFIKSLIAGTSLDEGFLVYDKEGKELNTDNLAQTSALADYYRILLSQPIKIIYQNVPKWLASPKGTIDATADGLLLHDNSIEFVNLQQPCAACNLLPFNFNPLPARVAGRAARLQEKIYVQTDKPYYYPKETIWMKGYLNYTQRSLVDSLSKTAYVELVDNKNETIRSQKVKIDSGFFKTEIWLPDTLKPGDYNLRAYTNFMLNFREPVFSKYLRVVGIREYFKKKNEPKSQSVGITIKPDQTSYKTKSKVLLKLSIADTSSLKLAGLSIAVTDMGQVSTIDEDGILTTDFQFKEPAIFKRGGLDHRMEQGISIEGHFMDNYGKPEKTTLTIVKGKLNNIFTVGTDEYGRFSFDSSPFFDEEKFSFQALDKRSERYGRFELTGLKKIPYTFIKPSEEKEKQIVKATETEQRILSSYELPSDAILLKEITVKAKRETEEDRLKRNRMFNPERIISMKDVIGLGNIVKSIESNVSGIFVVKVNPTSGQYYFDSFRQGSPNSGEPCIVLNDNFIENYDQLNAYPPEAFDRVEVTARSLGGCNGVLFFYTKAYSNTDPGIDFNSSKVQGYHKPATFRLPDYSKEPISSPDFRSTLYWNPSVRLENNGRADVSFFTSGRTGTYQIVVEGITGNGKPIRAVSFIKVER